ncbi:TIGR04222 domain-containing membrane protein [Micromonospora sp. NPDC049559]|uniref:TIGR04222 domain-containing membrane protein n=1 Tax=Micromonospora sp. NPDC049559 TaxID=3155923 RepID=UPI00343A6511
MMVIAAADDTWGISGPAFLAFYFAAVCVLLLAAVAHRAYLFAGRSRRPEELGPQQVAYLNGGERLALYTSLGGLRGAGAVTVSPDRTLAVSGTLPEDGTPLDRAVYGAAGNGVRPGALASEPSVAAALTRLREGLERARLVPTAAHRRQARYLPLLMFALDGLGLLRLAAGLANDKPVVGLIFLIILNSVLAVVLFAVVPRHTRAARAAIRTLRNRNPHLSPAVNPAYQTYGPVAAAMGVALFGGAVLWAFDPAFAEEAEVPTGMVYGSVAAGGSGGGSSGGGCGAGSSCGGGGGGCGGGGCGGGCGG